MINGAPVIDVDGHVLEPTDLFDRLEPSFAGRVAVNVADNGFRCVSVDEHTNWIASVAETPRPKGEGEVHTRMAALGGNSAEAYLELLDEERVDVSILYPTLMLHVDGLTPDKDLAVAMAKAYNEWIVDWCSKSPDRLVPVAVAPVVDPAAAAEEVRRAVADGCKSVMICADNPYDVSPGDESFDPLYAACVDLGVPLGLHISLGRDDTFTYNPYFRADRGLFWQAALQSDQTKWAATAMIQGAVFDRFPALQVLILESFGGSIPSWLERIDHTSGAWQVPFSRRPSSYFQTNLWASVDPDERGLRYLYQDQGASRILWATDFPHSDAHLGVVAELEENLRDLPSEDAARIIGLNAQSLFKLEPGSAAAR